ncbi:MAG: hypothetical protein WCH04_13235 [Gammaproteobacteria bacterium]
MDILTSEFYQHIASSILGLMDRYQRQRVANPDHRGNNGYPPHYPSERKWLVIDDLNIRSRRTEALLTDIAPSLLSLAGITPPVYMKGVALFTENEPHQ